MASQALGSVRKSGLALASAAQCLKNRRVFVEILIKKKKKKAEMKRCSARSITYQYEL